MATLTAKKPTTVDEYIADSSKDQQKLLKQIRATIKKALPGSGQRISYGLPCFTLDDSPVFFYAAFTHHVSVYPVPREHPAFKKELSAYKGGKGTAQFPLDEPLPLDLIARIAKFRMDEKAKAHALKKSKSRARTTTKNKAK